MNNLLKSFILLFLIFPVFTFAQNVNYNNLFTRDLKLGDSGIDVFNLQKILNQDPETRVAISGPGSINQETTYFGNLTHQAVIKFQNKYKNQVLLPLGLAYGTGYFGKSSRNFILNPGNSGSANLNNSNNVDSDNDSGLPKIISISPKTGNGKDKIIITGQNFEDENTILVSFENSDKYTKIRSDNNGTRISFDLEMDLYNKYKKAEKEIGADKYKKFQDFFDPLTVYIRVQNENGESNNLPYIFRP